MADSKISALPAAATPLAGTEVLPIVQSSATDQVTVANLTAGRAVSAASLTMSTGNLTPSTAAKGINYTANTPAAGMTSQLLNWYEEGTWTPVATSSIGAITTYTSAGWYTKVGRTVTIYGYVTITAFGTGSGNLNISGLPFTTFNTTNQQVGVCRESAATGKMGQLVVTAGATTGFIQSYDGTLAVGGNWRWVFNMTYISAT